MKVTAILPDQLIAELRAHTKGETLTASLIEAVEGWLRTEQIRRLNQSVAEVPLRFKKGFTAERIRAHNRRV